MLYMGYLCLLIQLTSHYLHSYQMNCQNLPPTFCQSRELKYHKSAPLPPQKKPKQPNQKKKTHKLICWLFMRFFSPKSSSHFLLDQMASWGTFQSKLSYDCLILITWEICPFLFMLYLLWADTRQVPCSILPDYTGVTVSLPGSHRLLQPLKTCKNVNNFLYIELIFSSVYRNFAISYPPLSMPL